MKARDVIGAYFEAVDAGDIDGVLALFDPEVIYERPGYEPIVGRAALRTFYESVRVVRSGRHTVDGVIVDGDHAAAWGSFGGAHRNGEPLTERWADVYAFRRSRIAFRRTHFFRPAI